MEFFFLEIVSFVEYLKKKCDKFKFSWLALLFKHIFKNQNSAQYEWTRKKKTKEIQDLLNTETKPTFVCPPNTKQKYIFLNLLLRGWKISDWNSECMCDEKKERKQRMSELTKD